MKLLSFLMRQSRGVVIVVALAGLITGASNAGLLAIINATLTRASASRAMLVGGFAALCILTLGCRILSDALLARLSQGAVYKLRLQLSRQILNAPLIDLEKFGAPRIMASLTDDVPNIANALTGIPPFCMNIATLAGCLIYLGLLSWRMLLGLLGLMVVGVLSYQFLMNKAMHQMSIAREHGDTLYQHFRALTEGMKELKVHYFRREAFLSERLKPTAAAVRDHVVVGNSILAAAMGWGQLLILIFIGVLLFIMYGGNPRTLTGFALVTIFLMTPIESILNTVSFMARANVSLKKVEEMGLTLAQLAEGDVALRDRTDLAWESLEFDGVTHSYLREREESVFTVGPVNLKFQPGELVFLVGGNGSGKTTFAKLFTGLYSPESGEVRLNGQPVTQENRELYRQHFAIVFSDFYLFESLLGIDTPELDEHAEKYLVKLHLDHKVTIKDGQLSTTELSQGQRKRLALLTAYLEGRPIYVFDEWAADQDPIFKEIFYHQLLPELKSRGKTILVISHDDRFYHLADRIIKLDDGQVVYDRPVVETEYAQTGLSQGGRGPQATEKAARKA